MQYCTVIFDISSTRHSPAWRRNSLFTIAIIIMVLYLEIKSSWFCINERYMGILLKVKKFQKLKSVNPKDSSFSSILIYCSLMKSATFQWPDPDLQLLHVIWSLFNYSEFTFLQLDQSPEHLIVGNTTNNVSTCLQQPQCTRKSLSLNILRLYTVYQTWKTQV